MSDESSLLYQIMRDDMQEAIANDKGGELFGAVSKMLSMLVEMKRDLDAHISMENKAILEVQKLFDAFPDKDVIKHRIEHIVMGEAAENRKRIIWAAVVAGIGFVTVGGISMLGTALWFYTRHGLQ